jgi:hypothetical protein
MQFPKSCVLQNTGRWTKSKNPVTLSVIHQRQSHLGPTGYFIFLWIHDSVNREILYEVVILFVRSETRKLLVVILTEYFLKNNTVKLVEV